MTENKRVKIAYVVTLCVFIFQFADVFFLQSTLPLLSANIFFRLIGIICLSVFSCVLGFRLEKFCFKSYGCFFEILYGLFFSLVPIFVTNLAKYIYFYYRGYENLNITFRPPGFVDSDGSDKYLINVLVYIFTLLLYTTFKEIFYRGYLITSFSKKFGVPVAIFIQSVVYMLSFIPHVAYYWYTGGLEFEGPLMSFFLICGHLTYYLISGVKWGLYYRVNGTVWMSVADHFFTEFVVTSFFFTENRLPEKWYIIELIAIQLLSITIFIPFFLKRDKENEIAAAEFALSRESLKMGLDNYSPSIIRERFDNKSQVSIEDETITVINECIFKEPISLDEIKKSDKDSLTSSIRGIAINDSNFNYKNEIDSHDGLPSEKVKSYFNDIIGRKNKPQDDIIYSDDSDSIENAQNISKLVNEYFNDNFNKHTFN